MFYDLESWTGLLIVHINVKYFLMTLILLFCTHFSLFI